MTSDAVASAGSRLQDSGCHVCELNAAGTNLPFRERLHLDEHWRVAHGWSSLRGWLVVASQRHVESLGELTPGEAARLGELLRAASVALMDVVGCRRTYVVLFAEQPRYHHVHLHVLPRMDWFTEADRGTAVFRHLKDSESQQVPVEDRERLAHALTDRMAEALREPTLEAGNR